jgi:anti-sigma28 factor (negative regulator of flagellin synthesis)
MVGIQGVGGIPEPKPDRPTNVRERKRESDVQSATQAQDGVKISSEAQQAASVARVVQLANQGQDVRAERVAAAKEAIAREDYKLPDVVREVAKRLSEYLT